MPAAPEDGFGRGTEKAVAACATPVKVDGNTFWNDPVVKIKKGTY